MLVSHYTYHMFALLSFRTVTDQKRRDFLVVLVYCYVSFSPSLLQKRKGYQK